MQLGEQAARQQRQRRRQGAAHQLGMCCMCWMRPCGSTIMMLNMSMAPASHLDGAMMWRSCGTGGFGGVLHTLRCVRPVRGRAVPAPGRAQQRLPPVCLGSTHSDAKVLLALWQPDVILFQHAERRMRHLAAPGVWAGGMQAGPASACGPRRAAQRHAQILLPCRSALTTRSLVG